MTEQTPVPFPHPDGPLAGYRVLDFADEKGQLCARLLGELGADVIKVEQRLGDPTRERGPFYRDEAGTERSLFWWTMNAGKRSITCDTRRVEGKDVLRQLVEKSDIVVETNPPGKAADAGLDYAALAAINPSIIVVSITNFGQTGPYKDMHATDIVASALGGHMYLNGDDERGPVRTTAPQAYAQVNFQAAVGAMTALYARGVNDGLGQHVDVSMQEAMANAMDNAQQTWDIRHINNRGPGVGRMVAGNMGGRYLFPTNDGWVTALQVGGLIGLGANAIIDWLAETGEARGLDAPEWRTKLTAMIPLEPADRLYVEETLTLFTQKRGKVALCTEAQRRNSGWAPVFGPRDIVESEHLAARNFWVRVQHEDIGESFIYPGAPWIMSETPWKQRGRAPRVGEHNQQVYGELLGLDEAGVRRLKMRMVV